MIKQNKVRISKSILLVLALSFMVSLLFMSNLVYADNLSINSTIVDLNIGINDSYEDEGDSWFFSADNSLPEDNVTTNESEELEIILEDEPVFDIAIISNADDVQINETFDLGVNLTIMDVMIFSLTANTTLNTPVGLIELNNTNISNRESTLEYEYFIVEFGNYSYNINFFFEEDEYEFSDSFEITPISLIQNIDLNLSGNINDTNITSFSLENETFEFKDNETRNSSNITESLINGNLTSNLDSGLNKSFEVEIIKSNEKRLMDFSKEYGLDLNLEIPKYYEYEYGPVLINSSISIRNDSDELFANATLKVYSEENPTRATTCEFEVNGSRQFYCELAPSFIEISRYIVKGMLLINGTEYYFDQYFDLNLKEEKEIVLDIKYEPFVDSGFVQNFSIFATDEDGEVSDAQISVKLTDPSGEIYNFEAKETKSGVYTSNFIGLLPGVYNVEVFFIHGNRYKSETIQYRVLERDVTISLDVPEKFMHTYGSADISGEIRLTKDDEFFSNEVVIEIFSETGMKNACSVICDGFCEFMCPIENLIEFGEHKIRASMMDGLIEYIDESNFTIVFEVTDVNLKIDYSPSYYLEEVQMFFVRPEVYDGYVIEDGIMFVEIIDSENNTYKLLPDEIDGGYAFSFIGIIPGYYEANVTFLKKGIYATQGFKYFVKNETYEKIEFERKQDWDSKKFEGLGNYITEELVNSFNESNLTEQYVQLPAHVNEPVRWVKIKKPLKKEKFANLFDKKSNNLKDKVLSKLVSEKYDLRLELNSTVISNLRNISEDYNLTSFSEFEFDYIETEKPRMTEFKLDDLKKEIRIFSNYHYKNITAEVSLLDIGESTPDKILIVWNQNDSRIAVKGIIYHDDNGNGLVDRIEWNVPHLSEQVFEIEILVNTQSFTVDELRYVDQDSIARFNVKYVNPDVDIKEIFESDNGCDFVINNRTYSMVPDYHNNVFTYAHEFVFEGEYSYRIYCGDNFIESRIEVISPSDLELKRSKESSSYYFDDLHYLTESSSVPENYYDNGKMHKIDTEFVPKLKTDRNISSLYYEVSKGLYSVELSSFNEEYPFKYSYDGNEINYKILGLGYYDKVSKDYELVLNASKPTSIVRSDDKIIYKNIFYGSDLEFKYSTSKFKEELHLSKFVELPSPVEFGFDPSTTYMVVMFEVDPEGVVFEVNTTSDELEIRDTDGNPSGIYLAKDNYYLKDTPEVRGELIKIIRKDDIPYTMMSGIPYFDYFRFESDIIIDPTFSIIATNRDAMGINNVVNTDYYDASTQYLLIGRGNGNGEDYVSSLQFALNVPSGSTITSAFVEIVPGTNQTGSSFTTNISVEDVSDADVFSTSSGNISNRNYWASKLEWSLSVWNVANNYTTPDLATLVQHTIDQSGWASGNYISFLLDAGNANSGDIRSLHDYSSAGNNYARLTVIYLANESRPVVELISPTENTITSKNKFNFSFRPIDDEGLDTCQLWSDFDGAWKLNQSLSSVQNNTVQEFNEVDLNDGAYTWNVWCNDTMGNYRFNETDFSLTVDTINPRVRLKYPEDQINVTTIDINFTFTVSDITSPNMTCNFTLDDVVNVTNYVVNNSGYDTGNVPSGIPQPHSVAGYIFDIGGSQVPLSTSYFVRNLDRDLTEAGITSVPVPGQSGRYSVVIDGVDGDSMTLVSWNDTHYGQYNFTLQGVMDGINVTLDKFGEYNNGTTENSIFIQNITVGEHNWTVGCFDSAGNYDLAEINTFNVTIQPKLSIWDDEDFSHNYSLFENITFYANYTDINGTFISSADCQIEFNDSQKYNMTSNESLYVLTRQFSTPYNISYNVTCGHLFYDSAINYSDLYIYPLINATSHKEITSVGVGTYNISLTFYNHLNVSAYVSLFDFVSGEFYSSSFSEDPIYNETVGNSFIGTAHYWTYLMNPLEHRNITYLVRPISDIYMPTKLYMVGLNSFGDNS